MEFMTEIRQAILNGTLAEMRAKVRETYQEVMDPDPLVENNE